MNDAGPRAAGPERRDPSPVPRRPTPVRPARRAATTVHDVRRLEPRGVRVEDATTTTQQLCGHFAARARAESVNRQLHLVTCRTLERAGRIDKPHERKIWERFLACLARDRHDARSSDSCAAAANLVGIALFADPDDFVAHARLARAFGHERFTRLLHEASTAIEAHPALPLTTTFVRRLSRAALLERLAAEPDVADTATQLVASCVRTAQSLLLVGVDPEREAPPVCTVEEFLALVDLGSIVEWRQQIAMVAAHPWSPYSRQLVELAEAARRPQAAAAIEATIELCRDQYRERERLVVAQEIKRLVAVSGASQREFAAWLGTSASRLSTYISGSVTPSAAMLLRIGRVSSALKEQYDARPRAGVQRPDGAAG